MMRHLAIAVALILAAVPAEGAESFSRSDCGYCAPMEFDRLVALLGDEALRDMACRLSSERYTPATLSSALGLPEGQVWRRIRTLQGWGLVRMVRHDSATTIVEPLPGDGAGTLRRWAHKYCPQGDSCGTASTETNDTNATKTKKYEEKRDFSLTPEPHPSGDTGPPSQEPLFVIQQHDARRMHYDFRIEVDGALRSWAVPKGPSMDPRVKRLAVPTEDHPLGYASFEGVIPAGQYGGGPVMVWDIGTYDNITEKDGKTIPIIEALAQGHAVIRLYGDKVVGGFVLQRIDRGKNAQWLLIKVNDKAADPKRDPVSTETNSVLTGRSLEDIKSGLGVDEVKK